MCYHIKNIIHILFIIVFTTELFSQGLNFQHYSTDDGLPQSTVWEIIQDSSGFIWFGTEAGLGRFDGINFKTYDLNDGLVGNNIGALHLDRIGGLWVGTDDGISILFENEVVNYTKFNGLPDDFIDGIVEDNDGTIWVATRYGGACKFIGSKIYIHNTENGFPSNHLSGVYKDSKGNIWFSTTDVGVIKYNGSEFITYSLEDGLISNEVLTIFEDKDGIIWIGTNEGITSFNGKSFMQYSEKEGFPEEEVDVIIQDLRGDIWFGLYNDGIYKYDGRKITKHSGLKSNKIRSAFLDKRGDLWFGTFLGGVSRLPSEYFEIFIKYDNITFEDVYAITQDDLGKMYLGHYGNGVTIFENNKFKRLTRNSGLASNDISSILFDSNKNLWLGATGGVTKVANNSKIKITKRNGLNYDNILKVYEDSKGNIWLGAIGGVSKLNSLTNKVVSEFGEEVGFNTETWVNDIYEDDKGVLWFATHYAGVITYDGKNFSKLDTSNGLPLNNLLSVMQDRMGYYWFTTDGKGIFRYDGKNFLYISEEEGLSSDNCYFIKEYKDELYIGTTNGISILKNDVNENTKEFEFRYISKEDGLPSKELNQGAYFEDKDGSLWFGTLGGLIKIDPKKEITEEKLPIFFKSVTVSDGIEEQVFTSSIEEEFNYEQNNITIEFFSISFAKPKETTYEFMLEGIEDQWSSTKENSVTYRALPSGKYKFWARAKNNKDANVEAKLISSFIIAPPFYKTWWFITLSLLFFGLVIYGVYFYKTSQVKKRNIALETMVKERTRELEQEKNKSDDLLHNILPSSLVNELKTFGKVRPRRFSSVSIMFTDFKAFTYTTSVLPPEELVYELNDIFKGFDALISKYELEKLKTIGDSYMAACGIPREVEDHATRIVYAAIDFQKMIKERNRSAPIKWDMRLGIHSGSVVAGVVGTKKFTYDIWGDTVNIASRMEGSGEPGEINISGYTYMLIRDHFDCQYRGKVETKDKRSIDMYFVKGIKHNQISNQTITNKSFKSFKQFS